VSDKVIVKEGQDMIRDFLGTVVKKVDFKDHPFETIFGAIGPILGWKIFGWKIGLLLLLAEYVGFGPGKLGGLVDDELNWKPGQALSLGSLKNVAGSVVDKVKGAIGLKSTSMLEDMIEIKGTLDEHDLVAIACANKYFPAETIEKQAIGRGGYFRKFLSAVKGGKKLGFTNVLYALLKLFAGGLAGLGLVGAVSGLAKRQFGVGLPEAAAPGEGPSISGLLSGRKPSGVPGAARAGNLYIVNEKGNVEDTLIHFLNSTIEGFSQAFRQVKRRPLKGSPEMMGRLSVIERLNGKRLRRLNREQAFLIPPVTLIASSLLPEAKYEKIGEPAPAAKPTAMPKPKGGAPAKKLQELLQGA